MTVVVATIVGPGVSATFVGDAVVGWGGGGGTALGGVPVDEVVGAAVTGAGVCPTEAHPQTPRVFFCTVGH